MATLARSFASIVLAAFSLTLARAAAAQSDEGLVFIGKAARVESGRSVEAAVVIGDDLVVAGKVDGIAAAIGGDVHVLRGADVDGAVLAIGGELDIDDTAKVTGPRVSIPGGSLAEISAQMPALRRAEHTGGSWGPGARLAQMLLLLPITVLLTLLAPRYVKSAEESLAREPALVLVTGLGALLALGPLCVLLALSIVGLPWIAIVALTFVGASALGMTALAITLGRALLSIKRPHNGVITLLLGMVILALGASLPYAGVAVMLVATASSVGATLVSRFGTRPPASAADAMPHDVTSHDGRVGALEQPSAHRP